MLQQLHVGTVQVEISAVDIFGKLIWTHKIEKPQNTCTNKHLNVNYFGTISDLTVNFKGFVCGHL